MAENNVLIVGLGNPLRSDDGIGPRIVEELAQRELPAGVTAIDAGTPGLDLLHILEGWKRAVIIDAAETGREAGQFIRLTLDEIELLQSQNGMSLHHAGLGEVLALAEILSLTLPKIVIWGVQPANLDWRQGLSQAVEAAVPALTDAVIQEIENSKGETHAENTGD